MMVQSLESFVRFSSLLMGFFGGGGGGGGKGDVVYLSIILRTLMINFCYAQCFLQCTGGFSGNCTEISRTCIIISLYIYFFLSVCPPLRLNGTGRGWREGKRIL